MLSRCKGKGTAVFMRCIAIPASSTSVPRGSLNKGTQQEPANKGEEEDWDNVMKCIPTSTKWRTLSSTRRPRTLEPDFFSSRRLGQSREYSTDVRQGGSSLPSPDEPESLFNSTSSSWDHVFENIDNLPPLNSMPVTSLPRSKGYTPLGVASPRRQTMTAREIDAFNNMFNMIFDAVQKQKSEAESRGSSLPSKRPRTWEDRRADKAARHDPLSGVGIGSGPEGSSGISDLFGKLRRVSRQYRWSPQEDADLERKLAQMELCETDQQLLEWAAKEVFDESAKYEDAARQAVYRSEKGSKTSPGSKPEPESSQSSSNPSSSLNGDPSQSHTFSSPLPLQPPAYPHLLAALISTFRDKFHDPHLALSIFQHARSRSIASYVFGCTAPAYNELLRTRWEAFRDLRGVVDALNEMRVNGITPDGKTRAFVEELRREVGPRTVWQEERNIGTGEVLDLLNQIETLSREPLQKERRHQQLRRGQGNSYRRKKNDEKYWRTSTAERWKLDDGQFDKDYRFGDWNLKRRKPKKPIDRNNQPSSSLQKLAFE